MENPYYTYKKTQIETASQEKLILLLFETAIRCLKESIIALEEKKIETSHNNLIKVQNIYFELKIALDLSVGEVANNLYKVYNYLGEQLTAANIKKDKNLIEEVLNYSQELYEAWKTAFENRNKTFKDDQEGINIEG